MTEVQTCGQILINLINQYGYQEIAEIGVYDGGLTTWVLPACPNIKHYYAIDPWAVYPEKYRKEPFGDFSQEKWDEIYKTVCQKVAPFKGRAIVIRKTSVEAAEQFNSASLDLVYIDAIHTFECVLEDTLTWLPKVKRNGIISGHDFWDEDEPGGSFFFQNVVQAVHKIFPAEVVQHGYPAKSWDHVWFVYKSNL